MFRKSLYLFVLFLFSSFLFAQTNINLVSHLDQYHSAGYNDIWGYVDPQGNEYALLGVRTGTSIISLVDPSNPVEVAFIPGPQSVWRDIKVHGEYAYTVTESTSSGRGLQIIDLSQLPNTATLVNTIDTWFTHAHNIFIDDGYAYVVGTDGVGGMHILNLSDPVNPTHESYYTASGYVHDIYVWNDTVVVCAGSSGEYHLVDVTDKANPQFISGSASIPGIYAHSGWMTEDKRYFYGTEEFNVRDITVWDLQDKTSWDLVIPSWQTNSGATVHNLFIKGNYAHISYYTDGYVVLDISDPQNPFLAGEYSTTEMWGCYPYLPSGITICSDMNDGLYVLHFTPDDVPPTITHTPFNEVTNSDPVTLTATMLDDSQVTQGNIHYRTIYNGNTSIWNMMTDLSPQNNVYSFEIPGQINQTVVEYYFAAQDDNDNVSTLPEGGSGANPPGSTPPPTFFHYTVMIPGQPVIESTSPKGDTTLSVGEQIVINVTAVDTSGFDLSYSWQKNGVQIINNGPNLIYTAIQNPQVPRTDTIDVEVSNESFSTSFTWLISVDNPTDVKNGNQPLEYALRQNYPNPFNPSTQLQFSIANSEFVNLSVYNMLGEKVTELINESLGAGTYSIKFRASNLPSGIYLARLSAGSFVQIIKMQLLK